MVQNGERVERVVGAAKMLAEACGNRTHPGRLSETRNGFEARENHQAPCASPPKRN